MAFRVLIKSGTILLVAALIAISGCVLYSYRVRWQAEKCLQAMQQLSVGSSTADDARKLLEPFHGYEADGTAMINGKTYPTQTYRFENKGIHLLWIFHPARFQTGVTFRNGIVIERGAGFLMEPFQSVGTREGVTGLLQNASLDESASGMLTWIYDPPVKMEVFLDTRASGTDRNTAYAYNLGCFTTLTGCKSVYEILPTVRQQAAK